MTASKMGESTLKDTLEAEQSACPRPSAATTITKPSVKTLWAFAFRLAFGSAAGCELLRAARADIHPHGRSINSCNFLQEMSDSN